jgi:hypothetical protein
MSVFSLSVVDCGFSSHHYTIENPQFITLQENTLIITPSRTHNLPHSMRKHSSLHHLENPQSTTHEENTLIITPSRTHNLQHSKRTHSSLHHREPTIYYTRGEHTHHYTIENPRCNDECVLLECNTLWIPGDVMMSVFSSSVVDCGFSMV